MKARARAAGDDIIDFGMGNPDQPTPPTSLKSWWKPPATRAPTAIP